MVLIRKAQKHTLYPPHLQHIEHRQPLRNRQPIVQLIMNHQHRRLPLLRKPTRIPPIVLLLIVPQRPTQIVNREVLLIARKLRRHAKHAIMTDERFKLPAQRVPLDPIHHVPAVAGAQGDGVVGVDEGKLVLDVREPAHEIFIWKPAPAVADGVGEGLAVAGRAGGVGADDDVALLGEDGGVPARGPLVVPGSCSGRGWLVMV